MISLAIAQPLAIWLGHLHRGSFLAINVSNLGRALPTLAVLAIGITTPLGLGYSVSLLALVVLAVPVMVTNSYVAVDRVDPDAVEAARGMGMTQLQMITKVEIPLALPLIFAGIKTAATYVVATAPVSSIVGGGGLGDILYDKATYGTGGLVGASIIIALLALAVQGVFSPAAACDHAARAQDRPRRRQGRRRAGRARERRMNFTKSTTPGGDSQ